MLSDTPYIIVYVTKDDPDTLIYNGTVQPCDVDKFVGVIRGQGGRCWCGYKEDYQRLVEAITTSPDRWLR